MSKQLKVGVIGCGYLGKFHAEKYAKNPLANLIGIFDLDQAKAKKIAEQCQTQAFDQLDKLLDQIEAVSVVTPTFSHFQIADYCLQKDIHVFIEKPITSQVDDAKRLIERAEKQNKVLQVGHSERYNPSYQNALPHIKAPEYIDVIRIAPFLSRATDVDVIHDLMIHDLDIIAQHCDLDIKKITGTSLSVITDKIDFAQALIELKNGTSVHLTASRISPIVRREMSFYSKDEIVTIDFAGLNYYFAPLNDVREKQQIQFEQGQYEKADIIFSELHDFIETILYDKKISIDGNDGLVALNLAQQIKQAIE